MSNNPLDYLPEGYRADEETPGAFYGPTSGPHECWHENLEDLIQTELLEFCGCLDAGANLLYILRGLELITEDRIYEGKTELEQRAMYTAWRARVYEHYKNEAGEHFFYYWADMMEVTEHGSSLSSGGWLTEKGKNLLELLKIYRELTNEAKIFDSIDSKE